MVHQLRSDVLVVEKWWWWWEAHQMSTARVFVQRLLLAAGGRVLRDLPQAAPKATLVSWLGPACAASELIRAEP